MFIPVVEESLKDMKHDIKMDHEHEKEAEAEAAKEGGDSHEG